MARWLFVYALYYEIIHNAVATMTVTETAEYITGGVGSSCHDICDILLFKRALHPATRILFSFSTTFRVSVGKILCN